jgi:hypothetical protein
MFTRREEIRKWLLGVIEKFREKGAVSPDKAMTAEELGLPPSFSEAMKRRLGRSGIFVEVNGKYYLSEERLKQVEEWRSGREASWSFRKKMVTMRVVQMITITIFVTILLTNLFVQSWELRVISSLFLLVWLAISIMLLYYVLRMRRHPY